MGTKRLWGHKSQREKFPANRTQTGKRAKGIKNQIAKGKGKRKLAGIFTGVLSPEETKSSLEEDNLKKKMSERKKII